MPIHTLEIIHDVNTDLSEEDLINTFSSFGFSDNDLHEFITENTGRTTYLSFDLTDDYAYLGLKNITIIKFMMSANSIPQYYLLLEFNPLLDKTGPEYLYYPDKENNDNLVNEFRFIMLRHFNCDEEYADLRTWKANRVDYTHDFIFDTKEQAELFVELATKTSLHIRTEELRNKSEKKNDQSAAEYNDSYKIIVYDKVKEINENRQYIPEEALWLISKRLGYRARFEVQCKKDKVKSIAQNKGFSRNIINFLDEGLSREILKFYYEQSVGTGDFYTEYHALKKIEQSGLKPAMKEKIFNLLRLIAQARSLDKGRKQFSDNKKEHKIKNTDIVVHGSDATFKNYLKELKKLKLNPVVIPKAWSSTPESETHGYGITFLHNPYDEL